MKPYQRPDRKGYWFKSKREDGRWIQHKGGDTYEEACCRQQQYEDNVRLIQKGLTTRGKLDAAEHSLRPIGDVIEEYVKHLEGRDLTVSHRKESKRCILAVVNGVGIKCLRDIDARRVERWLGQLIVNKRSHRTRNVYLVRFRGLLNWAVKRGMLAENPLRVIDKLLECDDRRKVSRALTSDEFLRLLANTPDEERRLCYLFAGRVGLRFGEISRLRWQDIDFKAGAIRLQAGVTKSRRDVVLPLAPDLLEALRRGCKSMGEIFSHVPILRTFKADLKRAGIEYNIGRGQADRKGLRKTFGTHLALNGVDMRITQRLMRHSTPALTSNIYTDENLLDMRKAVNGLAGSGTQGGQLQGKEAL